MVSETSIYLDYNATAPARPEVIEIVAEILAIGPVNASSVHKYGREARRRIEKSRNEVAELVGAKAEQVIFTMGGTEANNLVLKGCDCDQYVVSATEHAAVMETASSIGEEVHLVPVSENGVTDLGSLESILKANRGTTLVSVMTANNETGVLQPISEVVEISRRYGAKVHTDAVQAAGKKTLNFLDSGVDFMTLSAHKIGGPQGVGAIICRQRDLLRPMMLGGGQEGGLRAGTENVAGIAGFGVASTLAMSEAIEDSGAISMLRDYLEEILLSKAPNIKIFGAQVKRLPNTSCLTMPGVRSDKQVMTFDLAGVAISAGAACSAGKIHSSHVLEAMGFGLGDISTMVRVSMGPKSTKSDVDSFIKIWSDVWARESRLGNDEAIRSVA